MIVEELKKKILELNVLDRVHLAETLLDSLDKTDEEIEKIWVLESEKRYKDYKKGNIKGISLEQLRSSIEQ